MKWCRTLTTALGTGCKFFSKLTSESNKPRLAYCRLVNSIKDRTNASQVSSKQYVDAFWTWGFVWGIFFITSMQ